eukprot:5683971-Pleurochrysis_carterae.AAC.1
MNLAYLALEAEFLSRLSETAMDVNMNCLLQIIRYSVCVIYPDPRSSLFGTRILRERIAFTPTRNQRRNEQGRVMRASVPAAPPES